MSSSKLPRCAFLATYGQIRIAADLACGLGLVTDPESDYRKRSRIDSRKPGEFPWFGIDRRGGNGPAFFNGWACPGEDVRRVSFGEFVTLLYEAAARPSPEVEFIGLHRVVYGDELGFDSVKVGCTQVSRAEIEGILRHLDALRQRSIEGA